MKNHLGSYECKLCLTLHNNEGSYLAHTQGKKHQANLARRAAKEAKEQGGPSIAPARPNVPLKKFIKIGRPGYKVTKQRDAGSGQQSLLFQVDYPEIVEGIEPKHRFMSAYEQHIEPPDRKWQYLLFAAEPYETISFNFTTKLKKEATWMLPKSLHQVCPLQWIKTRKLRLSHCPTQQKESSLKSDTLFVQCNTLCL